MSPIIRNIQGRIRPSDLDRMVQILNESGVVIMPVDTVYGLIAKAFDRQAYDRLEQIKAERRLPYTVIFENIKSLDKWFGGLDLFRKRIIKKLLPGPVTFILTIRHEIPQDFHYQTKGIGIRVSSDENLKELTKRLSSPVWASSTNRTGEPAPVNYNEINTSLIQEVEMVINGGPTQYRQASTVIDLRTRPFQIMREGPWLSRVEQAIRQDQEPIEILVICTGNICRSPIAAGYLQELLGPVEQSGIRVHSAGTGAPERSQATHHMQTIAGEWGFDLSPHLSRQVTQEMLEAADLILVASPKHRDQLRLYLPNSSEKIRLLGELIGKHTIPDPYQQDEAEYRFCADLIRQAAKSWMDEFEHLLPLNLRPEANISDSESVR